MTDLEEMFHPEGWFYLSASNFSLVGLSVTKDGRQSTSFMQLKGELLLKGDVQVTAHIELLLRFTHHGGDYSIATW
jgi:hypothetical protein